MFDIDETPESSAENQTPESAPEGQAGVGQGTAGADQGSQGGTTQVVQPQEGQSQEGQVQQQEPQQSGMIGGKFKSFGAAVMGYVDLKKQLGEPIDVDNYADTDSLMKAYRDAEKRFTQSRQQGGQPQQPPAEEDVNALNAELARLEQEIIREVNPPQNQHYPPIQPSYPQMMQSPLQPGQMQPYPQQMPYGYPPQVPPKPGQSTQEVDPEEWLTNELYTKGPKAITELVSTELERQGQLLGQALYQVLAPMQQEIVKVRSERDYNRQLSQLSAKYPDLRDHADEIAEVYDKYPQLTLAKDGLEKAYQLAKVQKRVKAFGTADKGQGKQNLRMPAGQGTKLPAQKSQDQIEIEQVFGATEEDYFK
jgi:hypothetical protein